MVCAGCPRTWPGGRLEYISHRGVAGSVVSRYQHVAAVAVAVAMSAAAVVPVRYSAVRTQAGAARAMMAERFIEDMMEPAASSQQPTVEEQECDNPGGVWA
jgi:hypothetical protein